MSEVYSLIRRAIAGKSCVEAVFGGHRRLLCPHVLGTRDGQPRALFFQFGGTSSRGLPYGGDWRCLPLDGLTEVSIVEGEWRTKSHSQPQSCIEDVDVEVRL